MSKKKRTSWEVVVEPPKTNKRQRSWTLVRYPPSGAVDESGRRLRSERWSSGTEDYEEALTEARRAQDRLNAASGLLPGRTVESVVRAYVAGKELSESYALNCLSALKAAPTLATLEISKLTSQRLLLAQDEMSRGRANSTVNGYLRALRAAWSWAEKRGMVTVGWPKIERLDAASRKRPYEPEEVCQVLEWLERNPRGRVDWYAYFSLLADTGARPGELVRLRGEHVDRVKCRIYVTRNKTGRQGKLRREEWVRVPRETIELLPNRGPGEWLWPSRGVQARGHVTVNGALGALRRALKACGLPWRQRLDQYSFRRWWIDAADAEGVVLGDAMKQAGHEKAETHVGYRRNSRRAVALEVVEKVRARRLRAAPRCAPQQPVEHERKSLPYAASSLCSR